jgi:metallo-beta-lactamase class B
MAAKFARMKPDGPNVFVDPDGYRTWIADREQAYLRALRSAK